MNRTERRAQDAVARETADAVALTSNWPTGVVMAYDVDADVVIPLTQEKFDAIMAGTIRIRDERDRLLRLCQTHGLMIE